MALPELPSPRLAILAAAALALAGPPLAALPPSGLVGAETEDPPIQARVLKVTDRAGGGVPDVAWRLTAEGLELAQGRSFLDGSILLPDLPQAGQAPRIELAARGAARVTALPDGTGAGLVLEGARPLASPLPCEVVFVLDTTVSMTPRLPAVKAAILLAMSAISSMEAEVSPRFGLVLFRDAGDEYLVRQTPLSPDRSKVEAALAGAVAQGGGDDPEELGAGLASALADPGWSQGGVRVIFALTDAMPKEAPGPGRPGGEGWARAVERACRQGVRICAIGLGSLSPEAEDALREVSARTGTPYISADLGATAAPRTRPGSPRGLVRGEVETMMARIVGAELALAAGRAGARRDPALELLDSVQARMAAGLSYPEAARLRGASGTVVLALRVDAEGRLAESRVARSSASAILDRAALELAVSAFPQPNPAKSGVELEINVVYRLGR